VDTQKPNKDLPKKVIDKIELMTKQEKNGSISLHFSKGNIVKINTNIAEKIKE
jgi:hypothetical protein